MMDENQGSQETPQPEPDVTPEQMKAELESLAKTGQQDFSTLNAFALSASTILKGQMREVIAQFSAGTPNGARLAVENLKAFAARLMAYATMAETLPDLTDKIRELAGKLEKIEGASQERQQRLVLPTRVMPGGRVGLGN